jgi:F-type H+-transporting ATPase subunit delta
MQDTGELARPYAIAAFERARDAGELAAWADMLQSLETIVRDPLMAGLIANPRVKRDRLADLVVDVAGKRLTRPGQNLVRLLAENGRLGLAPDVARIFDEERSRHEGRSEVTVISAFELDEGEKRRIAEAMGKRLGTSVDLAVEVDRDLIGGVVIRAGDLVIDASLRGRLRQLSQALS